MEDDLGSAKTTGQVQRDPSQVWVIFGIVFAVATFFILGFGFFAGNLTCDQWRIIDRIWPICAGISAASFTGTIQLEGTIKKIGVAAAGGFAVYLLTTQLYSVPSSCNRIGIINFVTFDETKVAGLPSHRYLSKILRKPGTYYHVTTPDALAIPLGFGIVDAAIREGRQIDLRFEVSGLDVNGGSAWVFGFNWSNVDDWKSFSIPSQVRTGPDDVRKVLGIGNARNVIPVALMIECLGDREVADWTGHLRIEIEDRLAGGGYALIKPKLSLMKESMTAAKAACK